RSAPPGGGSARRAPSALGQRGLGLVRDHLERVRIRHGQIGQHLAVELDPCLPAPSHELVVGEAFLPRGGVDADDPEPPEGALARLAVAVRVDERLVDLLLGALVARVLLAPVALRLLEHLAVLLARGNRSLDAWHRLRPPEKALDVPRIGVGDRLFATERPLPLRGLLLELVALHRVPAQELPRPRHLEPLPRGLVCLLLWHSSLRLASSGPAP